MNFPSTTTGRELEDSSNILEKISLELIEESQERLLSIETLTRNLEELQSEEHQQNDQEGPTPSIPQVEVYRSTRTSKPPSN